MDLPSTGDCRQWGIITWLSSSRVVIGLACYHAGLLSKGTIDCHSIPGVIIIVPLASLVKSPSMQLSLRTRGMEQSLHLGLDKSQETPIYPIIPYSSVVSQYGSCSGFSVLGKTDDHYILDPNHSNHKPLKPSTAHSAAIHLGL